MAFLSAKRALVAGGLTLLVAASTLTLAFASQTPGSAGILPAGAPARTVEAGPGDHHQAFLHAVANKLGVTLERLQQAMTEARAELGIPEGKGGHRGGPGFRHGVDFTVAAQAIGITVEQLKQELPGKSLAQVAQAHGKSPADVATALKNAANQRIDQAVAAGLLPADQAAQAKQRAAERIDRLMEHVMGQPGEKRQRRGPRGGQQPGA